ncbi:MAG: hypothetical protein ABIG08_03555 [bacterium]
MKKSALIIFWLLAFNFLWIIVQMTFPAVREIFRGSILFLLPFVTFFLLGIILTISVLKEKEEGKLKKFMLLTGISATGVFLSVLFHNLIYGYFIYFYGQDFWERVGLGDEPVFFLLALIVFPILFLIGVKGTIITLIKRKK